MNYPSIISNETITIFASPNIVTVHRSQGEARFRQIEALLQSNRIDEAMRLADTATLVSNFVEGDLCLDNLVLTYKGQPVDNVIAERVIHFAQNNISPRPLMRFLAKLMSNPSKRAVDELYTFLQYHGMPIVEDGDFLAYKAIRNNFTDKRTGRYDNSIGKSPEMPRNQVDDNKDKYCSTGFHFSELTYASGFANGYGAAGGDRLIIVKVNPSDVVSIPADSQFRKARCCKYQVVSEYTQPLPDYYSDFVYGDETDDDYEDYDESESDWDV